jgi:hypothetical protein
MSAKGWSPELKAIKFVYDVAVQGGAVGTVDLGDLPDGFIVHNAVAYVETALVGGGTLVVGEDGGGDADGYWLNLDAAASGTAVSGSGALVASQLVTQPHVVAAAKDGVQVTIASTEYTAGKIHFVFSGVQPA